MSQVDRMIRRRGLLGGAIGAAAMPLYRPAVSAEAAPLKIGVLTDASGTNADLAGVGSQISAKMAVEDFGGTVLGRPIIVLTGDHQSKADVGMTMARQWYDDGVNAIFDIGITTVAIGVQQLAHEKNKIVVFNSTGSVDITGKYCSPNGIHWTYDSYSISVGAARANMTNDRKTWFFMTVDYTYGRSLQAEATRYIEAHGGKVLGSASHAIETKDFSSDLLKAQASGADLIGLATPTGLIANIVKQSAEFGLLNGRQKLAPIGLFMNDVHALGLPLAQGLLVTEPFYWDQNDRTRAFSTRFLKNFGQMPNSLQASVYGAVMHYLEAVKAANADQTEAVLKVMKAQPVNDFMTHDGHIRADGRLLRDLYVFRVKSPSGSKGEWDLMEQIATIPADQAFKPADPAACSLLRD
ncbi:ABC transporter substrate-binding protein [Rhodopila sp.]|uniref:ABC transporter substrate-binding protein n=1 Tax=Rhodopila sp. TaxID=2480087 RepID=UPI002C69E865|nr:ABC transporter substrate-binding protein [Rhodopila sp.]HVZ06706.1 ABC transporter substrate-binding protein [Rhodopila sp.]